MLREIEHGLAHPRRQGNTPSAQDVVRARQAEALALAYLLTGERDRAAGLAEAAFLALLRELQKLDPETDIRTRLIAHLAHGFLHNEYSATLGNHPEPVIDAPPKKYGVENQRERTLAALGRLHDRERTALLLNDMCGVDPGNLNQRGSDTLAAPIDTARQRLRQSLGLSSGDPLRPLLVEAGFDAPRDDLWPRLEGPYAEIQRREQRRRQLLTFGVAGAVILTVVITVAALFGPQLLNGDSADAATEPTPANVEDDLVIASVPRSQPQPTSTPGPTPLPAGDVPGGVMLAQTHHGNEPENSYTSMAVYDLSTNQLRPLLNEGERLLWFSESGVISPDGEQLIVIQAERGETTSRYMVVAFGSATFERQWETELGSFDDPGFIRLDMAVTSDRVYVASLNLQASESVTIVAFDRRDGSPRDEAAVDIAMFELTTDYQGVPFLFVPPDEFRLTVAVQMQRWASPAEMVTLTVLDHLALPTLTESSRVINDQVFQLWDARMTPDGNSLYALTDTLGGAGVSMTFFNMTYGDVTSLPLPFVLRPDETSLATTSFLSPDGRTLYVLHQTDGHVAVVNLDEQRIERTFPLDTGEYGDLFGLGGSRFMLGWSNALSTDGNQLFIFAESGDFQRNAPVETSGVWVLDLAQWRIADFWPVEGQTGSLYPIPGEQALLVSSWFYPSDRAFQTFTRFDLHTGTPLGSPVEAPAPEGRAPRFSSLIEMYQTQHGRSPSVNGAEPSSPPESTTLPRIAAQTTSSVVAAGATTAIEVHVLDPASGEILDASHPDVRFDRSSGVMAILRAEGQPNQIVVQARIEPGVYRGSVTLPVAGEWSIDVAVTRADGTTSLSRDAGQINVAPTFAGNDGRLYHFEIMADPQQPEVEETTLIQLQLVDIESGAPLPGGVGLTSDQPALEDGSIESMPERIDVAYTIGDGTDGYRTALLYRISDGIYQGEASFWEAGTWSAEIRFQPPGGRRLNIPAGTIEVVER